MEQDSTLSPVLRVLLVVKAAAVAGLATHGLGLRSLDVAMWTVLAGLAVVALLVALPVLRHRIERAHRPPAAVVLPERSAATSSVPDPAVQARAGAVDAARDAVLEARQRGAGTEELLALAEALHETTLDLARATMSAGGYVEPSLRHELALRDRAETSADAEQPAP